MDLHSHDTRHCANPGCQNAADPELVIILASQKVLCYCRDECLRQHQDLLKRHTREST